MSSFDERMKRAAPDVQEVDKRLQGLIGRTDDLIGDLTRTLRVIKTADGIRLMEVNPSYSGVSFFLAKMREVGEVKEAEAIYQRLQQIAGQSLTQDAPVVPCSGLIAHWDTFENELLPVYISARRKTWEISGDKQW